MLVCLLGCLDFLMAFDKIPMLVSFTHTYASNLKSLKRQSCISQCESACITQGPKTNTGINEKLINH